MGRPSFRLTMSENADPPEYLESADDAGESETQTGVGAESAWTPSPADLPSAPPNRAITLTAANFDTVLTRYDTVFVYLWAEACIPCRELKPRLDDLAARWAGDVALGTLKTDAFPALSKRNRSLRGRLIGKLVSDMDGPSPTLVLYRDGERVARTWGTDPDYDDDLDYFEDWVAENR